MSRSYDMQVEITGWDPLREQAVKQATALIWPFEDWTPWDHMFIASAESSLCGGESEEQFAERLAHSIWKANGKFCLVEVRATYLEELPRESYLFEEEDHMEFLKTTDEPTHAQEDRNNGTAKGDT